MAHNRETQPAILVTGSEGLIGQAAIQELSHDYRMAGFDVKPPDRDSGPAAFIQCDLTSGESVQQALNALRERLGPGLSSVIHLAAYYSFTGEPSRLYQDLTVDGTRRLLRGLKDFEVEQFIFSSTLLVMHSAEEDEPIKETSLVDPAWDYPRSKILAESVIEEERGNIPAVILRIAGVYNEDCNSVPIAQQISRIHEKKLESYFFPGDASRGQAFIHLEDLVECIRLVIERRHKLRGLERFLVAEPDVMSYAELQESIGETLHGKEWPAIRIPKAVAKAGAWVENKLADEDEQFIKPWMVDLADQHYPVAIGKARQKLGWEPRRRLRDTLPEMLRRLKSDPKQWYERNGLKYPA
jgi:nucleoside-diphosphate-sugar epimerase